LHSNPFKTSSTFRENSAKFLDAGAELPADSPPETSAAVAEASREVTTAWRVLCDLVKARAKNISVARRDYTGGVRLLMQNHYSLVKNLGLPPDVVGSHGGR